MTRREAGDEGGADDGLRVGEGAPGVLPGNVEIAFCHKNTAAGGRSTPIFSGYRPNWHIGRFFEGKEWYFDGQLELVGAELVEPGECGVGRISVTSPEYWTHLRVGDRIEMCEGRRVVATAEITALSGPDETA